MDYFKRKEEMMKKAVKHDKEMQLKYPDEIQASIEGSKVLCVKQCEALEKKSMEREPSAGGSNTLLEMCGIRQAIYVFEKGDEGKNSIVLNFASFKRPGGMFKKGSSAQEESLCHCSTLYRVLKGNLPYYERHKTMLNNGLYKTEILYSPDIVFEVHGRDDEKSKQLRCDVITCAAPNAGVARANGVSEEEIEREMIQRIRCILEYSYSIGAKRLYLGAFGCGVFKNNTMTTATIFRDELKKYDFPEVIFPIPDRPNFMTFKSVFME